MRQCKRQLNLSKLEVQLLCQMLTRLFTSIDSFRLTMLNKYCWIFLRYELVFIVDKIYLAVYV